MIKKIFAMLLVSCASYAGTSDTIDNGFWGTMKVIDHRLDIERYDKWEKTRSASLSKNFINLCCDFSETNAPASTEIFPDQPEVASMDIEYQFWTKQELQSEIEEVMKRPSGEKLLKVIASAYIINPNLQKIQFLTANILKDNTTKRLSSGYVVNTKIITKTITNITSSKEQVSSQIKRRPKYIVYVNSSDENAMYLSKDRQIKLKKMTKNDIVTHEMIHWMNDISYTNKANQEVARNNFMTELLRCSKDMKDKIKQLFRAVIQQEYEDEEAKMKQLPAKIQLMSSSLIAALSMRRSYILEYRFNNEQIFETFIKLLNSMIDTKCELQCMFGVIMDEQYKPVGWDCINESTTNTNEDIRVSHTSFCENSKSEVYTAMSYTAEALHKLFKFYEFK